MEDQMLALLEATYIHTEGSDWFFGTITFSCKLLLCSPLTESTVKMQTLVKQSPH